MSGIPAPVMIEQILVGAQQETAASAGRVDNAQFRDFGRGFSVDLPANGLFYNVIDNILRGVIHAAGLANFRFVLNADALVGGDNHQ